MTVKDNTIGTTPDCSTAGKGFARTDTTDIASEDCAMPDGPGKGFAKADFGNKDK